MSRLAILAMIAVAAPVAAQAPSPALRAAIAAPDRPGDERARDVYRHPAETLAFFGVAPGQTVVEYSPGGGWYTHVLMPLLAERGTYVAAVGAGAKAQEAGRKLVAAGPGAARAQVTAFDLVGSRMLAAPGSADRVLTFRNIHNMLMAKTGTPDGSAPAFFAAAHAALKPGGVLGVVEHRLPEDRPDAAQLTSGYVKRSTVIRLATAAGFRLAGESAVNANPKDTHDHPEGVWTLPPTYQLGDKDRATYAAIGESDRMTLRFVKTG